jgi:hypothetical protein
LRTLIFSQRWGLIAGSFLTPHYDITFSQRADGYKRRRRSSFYRDLCILPLGTSDPIFFFGGKDYVPLFATTTQSISGPETVFYNSVVPPDAAGSSLKRLMKHPRVGAMGNVIIVGHEDGDYSGNNLNFEINCTTDVVRRPCRQLHDLLQPFGLMSPMPVITDLSAYVSEGTRPSARCCKLIN